MSIYADTNFFTYLYLGDTGTAKADALFGEHRPVLPVTWLLRVEVINAFEQSVVTGYGEAKRRITKELAAICQAQFRDDLAQGVAMRLVSISEAALTTAFEDIALRHTAKHGFRTYDILHVAAAKVLKCRQFWSFDAKACKLAKLEGLKTVR